jgi:hypothetical protein
MLGSIVSFLGGVGDFVSYVAGYFKERGIRGTQKQIDELTVSLENCIQSKEVLLRKCEQDKELIKIKYAEKIDKLTADIDAATPKIGGRVIEG